MSDIVERIFDHERFVTSRTSDRVRSSVPSTPVVRATGSRSRSRAKEILRSLDAEPATVRPSSHSSTLPMGGPNIVLASIDQSRLETALLRLERYEDLVKLMEEGTEVGAFRMEGERILLDSPGEGMHESSSSFDITDTLKRAALGLKAKEASPLLNRLLQNGTTQQSALLNEEARLPEFVQIQKDDSKPSPVLKEGAADANTSIRKRIAEFIRVHDVLASADQLGGNGVLMVVGEPVRLSDGHYLPVEAVEEEARAALDERIEQSGRKGRIALIRADQTVPMPLPAQFRGTPTQKVPGGDSVPSPSRIELAYRLIKGISLNAEQGEPLDASLRIQLEGQLGSNFAGVRLHTGPIAKWLTDTLSARAVTADKHVFIPQDRVTEAGGLPSRTLVHELVHVKQANEGATTRPRAELESEARAAEQKTPSLTGMAYATKSRPILPTPGHMLQEGVFLASPETEGVADKGTAPQRKIELLEEDTLKTLESHLHEERQRLKEELRDRVF